MLKRTKRYFGDGVENANKIKDGFLGLPTGVQVQIFVILLAWLGISVGASIGFNFFGVAFSFAIVPWFLARAANQLD